MSFPHIDLAATLARDGEFLNAARYWTGGLRFDELVGVIIDNGQPSAGVPDPGEGVIEVSAPADVWAEMLAELPPRFLNYVSPALGIGVGVEGHADDGLQIVGGTSALTRTEQQAVAPLLTPAGDDHRPVPRRRAPRVDRALCQ